MSDRDITVEISERERERREEKIRKLREKGTPLEGRPKENLTTAADLEAERKRKEREDLEAEREAYRAEVGDCVSRDNPVYCCGKANPLHVFAVWLDSLPAFDHVIVVLIIINAVCLGLTDPVCVGHGSELDESRCSGGSCLLPVLQMYPCDFPFCAALKSLRPGHTCDQALGQFLQVADVIFLVLFTLELFIRVIAHGVVFHESAYFRSAFNWVDFIVVIFGWASFLPQLTNLSALRVVRVLRPLRFVTRFPTLTVVIRALGLSLPLLRDVLVVIVTVLLLFAIVGLQFMHGVLHYRCVFASGNRTGELAEPWRGTRDDIEHFCSPDASVGLGRACPPHINGDNVTCEHVALPAESYSGLLSFDNIGLSFLTIFQAITLEGWTDAVATISEGWSQAGARTYYFLLVLICGLLLMHLPLAVLRGCLTQVKEETPFALAEEEPAVEVAADAESATSQPTKSMLLRVRLLFSKVVSHRLFEVAIMVLIVFNTLVLAMAHYDHSVFVENFRFHQLRYAGHVLTDCDPLADPLCGAFVDDTTGSAVEIVGMDMQLWSSLNAINVVLTFCFAGEMVLKVFVLGFSDYLRDGFNVFDALTTWASLIEFVMSAVSGGSGSRVMSVFRMFRAFRLFRMLRIFRFARNWRALRSILACVQAAVSSVVPYFVIFALFLLIFALLGMTLFGGKFSDSPRSHFDSFLPNVGEEGGYGAIVTLFQILTTDKWHYVFYSAVAVTPVWGIAFFLVVILAGKFILLNLFLALLLHGFASVAESDEQREEAEKMKLVAAVKHKRRLIHKSRFKLCMEQILHSMGKSKRSLLIFAPENRFRCFCVKVVGYPAFDYAVLSVIVVTSILLAIDNPFSSAEFVSVLDAVVIVTNVLFFLEFFLKIVASGFAFGPSAYCKDSWNILDGVVLAGSLMASIFTFSSSLRVLRVLRALRPLRLIKRNPGMKLAVNCFLRSISAVSRLALVALLVFLIFSVVGVQLYRGTFYDCYDNSTHFSSPHHVISTYMKNGRVVPITNWIDCEQARGDWRAPSRNFDNVWHGILTVFVMATTDGWTSVLDSSLDSGIQVGQAPRRMSDPLAAMVWVLFMCIGLFVVSYLVVGVVLYNYIALRSQAEVVVTAEQQKWLEAMRETVRHRARREKIIAPDDWSFRQKLCRFVQHRYFEYGMLMAIFANLLLMVTRTADQPEAVSAIQASATLGFTCFFILEAVVKCFAVTPRVYILEGWNQFDVIVIVASLIGLFESDKRGPGAAFTLLRTVRIARLFRLFRVAPAVKGLSLLTETLLVSLPAVFNIGCLLGLMLFVFSVFGVEFFWNVQGQVVIGDDKNFKSFGNAFFLLFGLATGERWFDVLQECSMQKCDPLCDPSLHFGTRCDEGCGSPVIALIFFVLFVLLTSFVLLNLFVAIIVDNYYSSTMEFKDVGVATYFEQFKVAWHHVDLEGNMVIASSQLPLLIKYLPHPLGLGSSARFTEARRYAARLSVKDRGGYIRYVDCFRAVASSRLEALQRSRKERRAVNNDDGGQDRDAASLIKEGLGSAAEALGEQKDPRASSMYTVDCVIRVQALWRGVLQRQRLKEGARNDGHLSASSAEGAAPAAVMGDLLVDPNALPSEPPSVDGLPPSPSVAITAMASLQWPPKRKRPPAVVCPGSHHGDGAGERGEHADFEPGTAASCDNIASETRWGNGSEDGFGGNDASRVVFGGNDDTSRAVLARNDTSEDVYGAIAVGDRIAGVLEQSSEQKRKAPPIVMVQDGDSNHPPLAWQVLRPADKPLTTRMVDWVTSMTDCRCRDISCDKLTGGGGADGWLPRLPTAVFSTPGVDDWSKYGSVGVAPPSAANSRTRTMRNTPRPESQKGNPFSPPRRPSATTEPSSRSLGQTTPPSSKSGSSVVHGTRNPFAPTQSLQPDTSVLLQDTPERITPHTAPFDALPFFAAGEPATSTVKAASEAPSAPSSGARRPHMYTASRDTGSLSPPRRVPRHAARAHCDPPSLPQETPTSCSPVTVFSVAPYTREVFLGGALDDNDDDDNNNVHARERADANTDTTTHSSHGDASIRRSELAGQALTRVRARLVQAEHDASVPSLSLSLPPEPAARVPVPKIAVASLGAPKDSTALPSPRVQLAPSPRGRQLMRDEEVAFVAAYGDEGNDDGGGGSGGDGGRLGRGDLGGKRSPRTVHGGGGGGFAVGVGVGAGVVDDHSRCDSSGASSADLSLDESQSLSPVEVPANSPLNAPRPRGNLRIMIDQA